MVYKDNPYKDNPKNPKQPTTAQSLVKKLVKKLKQVLKPGKGK